MRWTAANKSAHPTGCPWRVVSKIVYGGPWVINTSVWFGILAHFSAKGSPLGKLKAQSKNSGCQGEPQKCMPSMVMPASSR